MKIRAWLGVALRMLRFRTVAMMWLFLAVGEASTRAQSSPSVRIILPMLTIAVLYVYATSVNDLADEKIDQINLQGSAERPLLDGSTTRHSLLDLAIIAAIVATALAALSGTQYLILTLAVLVFNLCYSLPPIRLSGRAVAPLFLASCFTLVPFTMGVWVNTSVFSSRVWLLAGMVGISFIGRIILKDFRDFIGDRIHGKNTFLVRFGRVPTISVAIAAWAAGDVLFFLLFSNWVLVLYVQLFIAIMILTLWKLGRERNLSRQLFLVTMAGRLGNAVGIMVLAALVPHIGSVGFGRESLIYSLVASVGAYTCYCVFGMSAAASPLNMARLRLE